MAEVQGFENYSLQSSVHPRLKISQTTNSGAPRPKYEVSATQCLNILCLWPLPSPYELRSAFISDQAARIPAYGAFMTALSPEMGPL